MPQSPLQLSYVGEQPIILSDDHPTELRTYLDVLLRNAWMIGWVTLIVTVLGTLYAFTARPVYEASLTVQVEEKGQRGYSRVHRYRRSLGSHHRIRVIQRVDRLPPAR